MMGGINPAAAYALMPRDNFTQRRADDQFIIQTEATAAALAQQSAQARLVAQKELRATFDSAVAADLLVPDRNRITDKFVKPWRKKVYQTLTTDYAGDPNMITKFMAEKGDWMLGQMAEEIANSKEMMDAQANKLDYASYLKDRQDDKVTRGDFETSMQSFFAGDKTTLGYGGAYKRPEFNAMEFTKTPHPDYQYGLMDANGRRRAPKVTLDEQIGAVKAKGLSGEDAMDWMIKKGNFNSTLTWGMEDPMNLQKMDLAERKFGETRRQNGIDNAIDRERLNIAKKNLARQQRKDDKVDKPVSMGDSYIPLVYGDQGNPMMNRQNQAVTVGGAPVVYAELGDAKAQAAVAGLAGMRARTTNTKTTTKNGKVTGTTNAAEGIPRTSSSGAATYDVNATRLRDANDPNKSFGIEGGKAKVFNVQTGRIIKMKAPSEKGTINGYSSWLPGQIETKDGVVHDILIPVNASKASMTELNSMAVMNGKKENQKVDDQADPLADPIDIPTAGARPVADEDF